MRLINPHAPLKDMHGVVMLDEEAAKKQQAEANGELEKKHPLMFWVERGRQAYESSTSYFKLTQLEQIRRNLDNFASRHPEDSRYHTEEYKYRSRTFKPKTRIASRQLEEDAAQVFFASEDLIDVRAVNRNSKQDTFAARLHKFMLEEHLEENLPYFEMVMGGVQDAFKQGDVVSHIGWESEEADYEGEYDQTTFDGQSGELLWEQGQSFFEPRLEYNRPTFRLIPIENIHVDPGASWIDPIKYSPYVIEDIPMHIQDVQERMMPPGQEPRGNYWFYLPQEVLMSCSTTTTDTAGNAIRSKRNADSMDPLSDNAYRTVKEHQLVMVQRVIMRVKGEDYLYYMVGGMHLLSIPAPLIKKVPWLEKGERDYQWGVAGIETHRVWKSAPAEWLQDLQGAANIEHNQRTDNIQLALNKRYKVKRGAVIDLTSLRMSVPGGIYEVSDMDDVEPEQWSDVGGASFYNEDRLGNDFDALAGAFSQGSVASQRNLNETVGGMRMMSEGAGKARSYMILSITATWWSKVVDALMRSIKTYSTEREIAKAVDMMLADNEQPPEMLPAELMDIPTRVKVNMRLGTDPLTRMNNLMGVVVNFKETPVEGQIDWNELFKEAAGSAGYGDGDRFLMDMENVDPQVQALAQENEQLKKMLETKELERQTKIEVAKIAATQKAESDRLKSETQIRVEEMKQEIARIDAQLEKEQNDIKRGELELAKEGLIHQIRVARFEMERELEALSESDAETPAKGEAGSMARDDYGKIPGQTG